ncbi:JAB domain-containing protein [Priestia koreensis]|uniref:JAB domain-containing protein n=1 Tax=Priestia koreensis TaxID=284581 RepID=UPI001F5A620C|nr:JAB domain-containing protein [Priestia koreensis]UNL87518.1 hypothetical protein IE339_23720 [Priestia koreensis]
MKSLTKGYHLWGNQQTSNAPVYIYTGEDAAKLLLKNDRVEKDPKFVAYYLDDDFKVIDHEFIYLNSLLDILLSPGEIIEKARRLAPCQIVTAYLDKTYTRYLTANDITMMSSLKYAFEYNHIQFRDHLFVGKNNEWVSLIEEGYLKLG